MQDGDELIKADHWTAIVPELLVTDIDRSVDAYTTLFGFEAEHTRPGLAVLTLPHSGAQIVLEQYDPESPLIVAELKNPLGRGVSLSIRVDDPAGVYQKLRSGKYPIMVPMQVAEYDEGDKTFTRSEFVVQDPDGYVLRFTD